MNNKYIIKELIGHSGCKIYLMNKSNRIFVRKIAKDQYYNERLQTQCQKQANYKSIFAGTPRVIKEGTIKGHYYYDMDYIRGHTLSFLVPQCSIDRLYQIADLLVNIIIENKKRAFVNDDYVSSFKQKIHDITNSIPKYSKYKLIKKTISILKSHDWSNLSGSYCHGDFTLENIIISLDGEFYIIDFLDTFSPSWLIDVSKVLQDLIIGWTFRQELLDDNTITENLKVKIILLKQLFVYRLNKAIDGENIWEDAYFLLLMNLLRIIPYITEKKVLQFVTKSMDAIIYQIEKGDYYEHVNNTVCWPVFKIPRS